ncbi:MAG: ABC transporter ATP-binding protein/permease [Hyphomicrobium sp.]|jgi:ATP-binding cassette subfamily B multidrug efflux pump|uniref:ABC transporter ATP-binding protein n=1 Tax=Hyphomicrobium sp. TaxID=82 RepID=UPI0025C0DB8A|nr:ABC transporter ATP-binding protein [Hyphomicrobium sp.]MBX9862046.1 ABC transporter ATP-binding protein/permease [Hyphomicrobium sp.]
MFRWFETRIDPFAPAPQERPPANIAAFYWHYIKPVWRPFAVLLVIGFFGSVIEVLLMAFVGNLVDLMRAASSPQAFFSENAVVLTLMAIVAVVARPAVSTVHDLVKNQMITPSVTTRIRWQTHTYVLRQSLGFFQNDFAGRISTRIMQTGASLRDSVVQGVDAIWYMAVHVVGALVIFWEADARLVIPLLAWIGLYAVVLRTFVPRIQKLSTEASEARSWLTGRVVDSFTNILTVKLFAHAEREEAYAREAMQAHLERHQASLRNLTVMEFVLYTLNGALLVSVAALALWLWSHDAVTMGAITVAMTLSIRIIAMSGWILFTVAGIFENIGVVHEGMQTISRDYEVVDKPGAPKLEVPKGEIRFEDVRFHYGKTKSVIEEVALTIKPGEKVGIVGRSGAGKSTLVNLLLRFYDVEAGRILIDGQDISQVTQESLRANIGLVTQDTSLLHRSVLDNILYGRPEAGEAQAIAAAKRAHAHDFIQGLEDMNGRQGYQAHVGERGVKLSGGQRQRIAIARVLLKNAPILVLDEATSALDSEVEAAIQESLSALMGGKTVIAIAHRLSTIAAMDRLIIMDEGRIVEQGSHAELLRRGGLYASLWARQSGGFLTEDAAE